MIFLLREKVFYWSMTKNDGHVKPNLIIMISTKNNQTRCAQEANRSISNQHEFTLVSRNNGNMAV